MMTTTPCRSLQRTPLMRMGTVIDYSPGGDSPQHLIVEISAQQNCEQCAQGRGCGVGLLAPRRSQRIAVAPPANAHNVKQGYPLGTPVTISLPRASVTLLAFCIYALPLFVALVLSGLAAQVSATIWLAPLVFFIALGGGVLSVKYLMRGRGERFRPRLVS
ncbi:MAG: SoxR reducing system RseC family protein [Halomonas sp.]|uniref:SoxR reducing system RseC family protein n=1 Tax=unclassified Halomonas TaxID=2609666 RepID=UPI002653EF38|nr:SoxR reducing system RseC family protein [Halomonas sp.]